LALTEVLIFCTVSPLIVHTPEEAPLFIPVKLPEEVRLNWLIFSIVFPFNNRFEFTRLPSDIPAKEVVVALEVDNTRILLDVVPLPIILLLTWAGAEALFTYMPINEEEAGAVPLLFISNPATWLPIIFPPELAQLIPFINDVLAVDVVAVVTITEPLLAAVPTWFPSPSTLPPIFIPEPLVSIPIKAFELAAVGAEERDMPATVLPLIFETGKALFVVNKIPWYETLPDVDEYIALFPDANALLPPI
jgi:hypothetical protein